MNSLITSKNEVTMSSREIAELVRSRLASAKKATRPGYIYLISSPCGTKTKIGRSAQPNLRTRSIISISGGGTHSYTSCVVQDAVFIESALHKAFNDSRIAGEWFDVSTRSIINTVDEVCKQFQAAEDAFEVAKKQKSDHADLMFEKMSAHFGGGK